MIRTTFKLISRSLSKIAVIADRILIGGNSSGSIVGSSAEHSLLNNYDTTTIKYIHSTAIYYKMGTTTTIITTKVTTKLNLALYFKVRAVKALQLEAHTRGTN